MSTPSAAPSEGSLGIAQIQDLRQAIVSLKEVKKQKFGDDAKFIAYCDSHDSQSAYFLATVFDKIYLQRSGSVALVGLSNSVPFVRRLLDRFGIQVKGNARKEYKSITSTFTETSLPGPQKENALSLLFDLNDQVLQGIAEQRYKQMGTKSVEEGKSKLAKLIKRGPFSAEEAQEAGFIDGLMSKRAALSQTDDFMEMNLGHYARVRSGERLKELILNGKDPMSIGLVYVLGGINRGGGPYGANTIVKGIKQAMQDPSVGAIVLRVDSGGGDVTASDTMFEAIQYCKDWGYPVVASFGNTAASGGYWIACHANKIIASQGTITGSIGVASIRPYFTKAFFEWLGVDLESFFTGSTALSLTTPPDPLHERLEDARMDKIYDDFLRHVAEGRNSSRLSKMQDDSESPVGESTEDLDPEVKAANEKTSKAILKQAAIASEVMKATSTAMSASAAEAIEASSRDDTALAVLSASCDPIFPNGIVDVDKIAGGRVWTGRQAYENGLVDSNGGLLEAIAVAKQMAWDQWDKRSLKFVEETAKLAKKNGLPRRRHDVIDGQMETLKDLGILVAEGQPPIPREELTDEAVIIKVFPMEESLLGLIRKARKRRDYSEVDPDASVDFSDYAGSLLAKLVGDLAKSILRQGLSTWAAEQQQTFSFGGHIQ